MHQQRTLYPKPRRKESLGKPPPLEVGNATRRRPTKAFRARLTQQVPQQPPNIPLSSGGDLSPPLT